MQVQAGILMLTGLSWWDGAQGTYMASYSVSAPAAIILPDLECQRHAWSRLHMD